MNLFENYLRKIHMEENPELLDDDLPDAFDSWLGELDGNDVIEYANQAMEDMK